MQAGLAGGTDAQQVARLCLGAGVTIHPEAYRLATPCSPHAAARIDGVTIADADLALPDVAGNLVVEGAGGVLVPYRDDLLAADLFARWGLPVILVARTTLGTISHSLLSIEALRARSIAIAGVAFIGAHEPDCRTGHHPHRPVPAPGPPAAARSARCREPSCCFCRAYPHGFVAMTRNSPVWHPFTQHGLGEPIRQVERGDGAALYTSDGRRIIDAISSWWVTTHGHNHPRIIAAIADQAQRLDQVIFAGWTHEPAEQLAHGLTRIMPPALEYVFFSDSGSTSVEVALKMALGYWHNRGEARHRIMVMQHSYHGDTIGAMSVGERGVYNRSYQPLLFDVGTIPFPHAGGEQASYDALEQACRTGNIAAFIVEPLVLGAGGMLIYPPAVLAQLRAICARHNVLFIADEVMTGWGRTGTLLACEQAGVVPDILCLAKGLTGGSMPLAVTMASAPIFDAHCSADRSRQFFHSSSYTANPIACAAANANLAIWRDEPVLQRIATLAAREAAGVARIAARPEIANLRQSGSIIAFDIAVADAGYLSQLGPRLLASFNQQDILLRPLGNTIYLMPPYCLSQADLDAVFAAIETAIETALDQTGSG